MAADGRRRPLDGLVRDVLVIGGGPAAAWAALAAAEEGASVVLVDKGYMGTSGATAPSTTGVWYAAGNKAREAILRKRVERGLGLASPTVIGRVIDAASQNIRRLAEWGYAFPRDDAGELYLANLRGPDYMRFMRRQVLKAGVRVFDHHPALELIGAGAGIAGAAGVDRRGGLWRVRAGAVVLASGGCAFGDRILGTTGLTGDANLMAAEAGARFSGMEFSAQYGIAPLGSAVNKGITFSFASFYDTEGNLVPASVEDRYPALVRAMAKGPILARFDRAPEELREVLRRGQPNCFLPFDRLGIDPFTDLFLVSLRCEGTVRGTGGLLAREEDCSIGVPGLFAAGDTLDRQDLAGATTGGGGPNAAWAISTGVAAGKGAARHARMEGQRHAERFGRPLGTAGLRAGRPAAKGAGASAFVSLMQEEMLPLDRNFFRTASGLEASLERLDGLWTALATDLAADDDAEALAMLRNREVAAMIFTGRLAYAASLARPESRGINRRADLAEGPRANRRRTYLDGRSMLQAPALAQIQDIVYRVDAVACRADAMEIPA